MELPTYFADFLKNIRPSKELRDKMRDEHKELRDRLAKDDELGPVIVSTFIQGSYRRFTGVRPSEKEQADVDVVAVTTMSESQYTPRQALDRFKGFLEKNYKGKYEPQGRSWAISSSNEISLDLVPTSAPSEAVLEGLTRTKAFAWELPEEPSALDPSPYQTLLLENALQGRQLVTEAAAAAAWKAEPLRIPDRDANAWDDTHPLEQIRWTWLKSNETDRHYVNVVKAIKWWRRTKKPLPKYPKSYPLEHMIGDCCPNEIGSVAVGVTRALEVMEESYRPYVQAGKKPHLADRGVPLHDVIERVTAADFASFLDNVNEAAKLARSALDATSVKESARLWRELFGDKFPDAGDDDDGESGGGSGSSGGFTPRKQSSNPGQTRFAE